MQTVALNDTHPMPTLGLGVYLVNDVRECERSVSEALRAGYRLIDTAAAYGNERAVGRAITASTVPRQDIFLTTKIWPKDYGHHRTRTAIARAVDRLGTGPIDLLLLHQPFGDYLGAWKALEEAVAAGTVRSIGVSNFGVRELQKLLAVATVKPAVNQVERHPYFQQVDLTAFHAQHDIVGEAWYPLGHGAAGLLAEPVLVEVAAAHGKTPVQVILRWHVQSGFVAIPKSTNARHIEQNIDVYDFALSDDEMTRIAGLDRNRSSFRMPRWLLSTLSRVAPTRDLG